MFLTNVTSVCLKQEMYSFLQIMVATAVGLGFELFPFLLFPFPLLLTCGKVSFPLFFLSLVHLLPKKIFHFPVLMQPTYHLLHMYSLPDCLYPHDTKYIIAKKNLRDQGHFLNFLQSVYNFNITTGTRYQAQKTKLDELFYVIFLLNHKDSMILNICFTTYFISRRLFCFPSFIESVLVFNTSRVVYCIFIGKYISARNGIKINLKKINC